MTETPEACSLLDFDRSNMFEVLKNFPAQVREGIAIGEAAPYFHDSSRFPLLVFAGMGGSAIAGDLLRCTLQGYGADDFAVIVNRTYGLPSGVNSNTAFIGSSYSGNTEETLAAYQAALGKTKRLLCIATGGELKKRAEADGVPLITIPDGLQPRCAVGYSLMPVLVTLLSHGAITGEAHKALSQSLRTLPEFLDTKALEYSQPNANNPAFALAERLRGTIPVFYSAPVLEAVNLRWRGQIQENGKHLAFGNIVPEMNHNEINSWVLPGDLTKRFSIVFLRTPDTLNRMAVRFQATKNILQERAKNFIEIHAEGSNLLEQMFSLVYLADWTSYWLALLNDQDPTEIKDILALKAAMTANS
ncbi:MAG: bifunctional phosphoglucose/phosphomannose isomerase [Ignavibacteria bacterium]|nr:bifunctional phosphoglucose/phosphomannose isomerase [Ignavibacteria bacterium]